MSDITALLLYLVFALGGAGVYFLLPQPGRPRGPVGAMLGLSAIVALLGVLAVRVILPASGSGFFYPFAAVAVWGAARVVTHPKPVYSAVYFVVVVFAVAALLVLQQAEFVAIALVIIYAGAILVTYLFVIMLAQQSGSPVYDRRAREPFAAVVIGFVLMAAIAGEVGQTTGDGAPGSSTVAMARTVVPPAASMDGVTPGSLPARGNTFAVGAAVMTKYVVALEISGVLLLVAMVGAIALSRKKVPVDVLRTPPKPLGQVGREAEPF